LGVKFLPYLQNIWALPLGACFKVKATWDRFLERTEKKAHKLEEDILVKGW